MIIDAIQIYRARSNKPLATKLALRFAQGQLLDRAAAPLLLVHLLLWCGVVTMGLLVAILIFSAIKLHGSLALIALIPAALGFVCAWISLRLKSSLDYIRELAAQYSDTSVDRLLVKLSGNKAGEDEAHTPLAVADKRC